MIWYTRSSARNEGEWSASRTNCLASGKRVGHKPVLTVWSKEIFLPLPGIEFQQPGHPADSLVVTKTQEVTRHSQWFMKRKAKRRFCAVTMSFFYILNKYTYIPEKCLCFEAAVPHHISWHCIKWDWHRSHLTIIYFLSLSFILFLPFHYPLSHSLVSLFRRWINTNSIRFHKGHAVT
jgi:hypothetical protein